VLREDPKQKGLLYAGTETGMYISFDDGNNWKSFQLNLPIVPITDLTTKDNNLIVATQGRSLWIIDDLSVIHQLYSADLSKNILFKPKDTYRMSGGSRKGSKTAGTNHPNGVLTHFNLKDLGEEDKVSLTYFDKKGDTIKTYSNKSKKDKLIVKKGANQFVWNMTYDGAERLPGMILWAASLQGPIAVPGAYKVSLNVNGDTKTQPFNILADPRSESTTAEIQKQFDFIQDVNGTVDKAHKSIKKIRSVNKQLGAFQKQYIGDDNVKELLEKAKKLQEELSDIEKALYQTKNRSGQDPLNFPIRLTDKLGGLNSLTRRGDFPPTDQAIVVKNELTQKINTQLNSFNTLLSEQVKAFNTAFNSKQLNYLFIEE
jgi:hypothetical protein